jgi:hypothetical protein
MTELSPREQGYVEIIKRQVEEGMDVFLGGIHPLLHSESDESKHFRFSDELVKELIKLGVVDARFKPDAVPSPKDFLSGLSDAANH